METPVYLPEQRALVFADGMTAPGGVLRVWARRGTRSARCPPCARCSRSRSSTCSSPTASRCTPRGLRGRAEREPCVHGPAPEAASPARARLTASRRSARVARMDDRVERGRDGR